MVTVARAPRTREFFLRILGRTLEHLGVQMYKRRDVAIAELVANSWDAGARRVSITVPEDSQYDPRNDMITVTDDGIGMSDAEVEEAYLVVGRNRRRSPGGAQTGNRPVMGKKGIGKLAGLGIASRMTVTT